jgi:hypothetical protein
MNDLNKQFESYSLGNQTLYPNEGYASEFIYRVKKNGTKGKRFDWVCNSYCPYLTCEICKKQGGKRKIFNCYLSSDPIDITAHFFRVLCLGCKNKMTANLNKFRKADELRITINRIKRKLNESTKNNA